MPMMMQAKLQKRPDCMRQDKSFNTTGDDCERSRAHLLLVGPALPLVETLEVLDPKMVTELSQNLFPSPTDGKICTE